MAPWTAADIPDQTGRVTVVTGANIGLGFETAKVLAGRRVVVLGAGKVGSAVAGLLAEAGMEVAAMTRHDGDNAAAAAQGDIVLVTVNDDAIAGVVARVAAAGGFRAGQMVAHMSGALPLAVLEPAADAGADVGCLHPLQSFASADDAARLLPGSVFGITPGSGAREAIEALVEVLGGEAVLVADADKALYHAAAVTASNYLVAVEDTAVHLLMRAGFDEDAAMRALRPLMAGTAENVSRLGTTDALTGPIVRGDVETVRGHIEALRELPGDELGLYRTLGRRTLEIAQRRGTLAARTASELRELLSGTPAE